RAGPRDAYGAQHGGRAGGRGGRDRLLRRALRNRLQRPLSARRRRPDHRRNGHVQVRRPGLADTGPRPRRPGRPVRADAAAGVGGMTMRMGGRLLALYAIVFAVVIGFRDQLDAWGVGTLAFGAMAPALAHIVEVTGSELKAYKPVSALDARIANEKIKLWIGTLNAVANALIIGGL